MNCSLPFSVLLFVGVLLAGCIDFDPPATVFAQIVAPASVPAGQAFNVTISIQNSDNRVHRLDSIDIPTPWLKGMDLATVYPSGREPFDIGFGQHSFGYDSDLPADSEVGVVFSFIARSPGTYYGQWSVCIDGVASCHDQDLRIVVS